MGAITQRNAVGPDRIRRYRTKIKVRIDSHDRESPMFIDDDVFACNMSKTIKGAGQANLVILPRRNYLNLIRPNDYINIYFNIGDGEGWTRTFFGMVDKIEETYEVGRDGKPVTKYNLIATDFYKVFEKTMVYFNPHLSGRADFSGESYGTANIGGLALMSRGIRVFGSPADCVVNLILLLLGFGTQWTLPPSYPTRFGNVFRQRRAQFIQNRLAESARQAIEDAGGFDQLLANIRQQEAGTANTLVANSGAGQAEQVQALFRERGITNAAERNRIQDAVDAGDSNRLASLLADRRLRQTIVESDPGRVTNEDRGALDILRSSLPTATASLLDVIDVFGFVERTAIDGYATEAPVWQQTGPIIQHIRALSHELMNELIFDLRPVLNSEDGQISEGLYSREPDELEGNVDPAGDVNGITHVPALVMREYPFSTIDGVDLRGVEVGVDDDRQEIGILYFGDIFATEPNRPGRHAVQIPNINIQDIRDGRGSNLATKHLDVAVISEEEITKTSFGRSDHEHFNLTEFYADSLLGTDMRFYMHDLLPIVTPVHVMRHGLRVRSLTTRFARFSYTVAVRQQPAEDTEEVESAEEAAQPEEAPVVSTGNLVAPALASDGARFRNAGFARWGYREKPNIGPNGSWVMHQGIDIVAHPSLQGTPAALDIPIYAIADGEVVCSAPEGAFGGYGNLIVIRHDFDGTIRYSVYAHLSTRLVGPELGVLTATRRDRRRFCAQGFAGGRSANFPIRVSQGDIIGRMGNTGFSSTRYGRVHLHFEIDRLFPPRNDNVTPRFHFADPGPGFDEGRANWSDTIIPASGPRPEPPAGFDRSFDPVAFYADGGAGDLVTMINSLETITETESNDSVEPEEFNHGPQEDEDGQRPRDDVLQEAGTTAPGLPSLDTSTLGVVDSALTRQQVIRWAVLQDHWYQHNLEYVAGRIDMRGAPEIRVGYRLDIEQRNLSFYVEGVNHQWKFPDRMVTSLQVTRGQRNDPFPMYVLPPLDPFNATDTQRRTSSGRLARYFIVPDPIAVRRALVLRTRQQGQAGVSEALLDLDAALGGGQNADTVNIVDSGQASTLYQEAVVLAGSVNPDAVGEGDPEADTSRVRISGDLRFQLELLELDDEVRDALRSLDEVFGFTGSAADEIAQDGSTTETDSGITGRDTGASLDSDLTEDDLDILLGL